MFLCFSSLVNHLMTKIVSSREGSDSGWEPLPHSVRQILSHTSCQNVDQYNYDKCFCIDCSCFLRWFSFVVRNEKGARVKEKNISIFICGINMSCVVSIYCTIHRVNCISFSRQKGETAPVNMPLVFIHRQIASLKRNKNKKKTCLQHNTKQLFNACLKL